MVAATTRAHLTAEEAEVLTVPLVDQAVVIRGRVVGPKDIKVVQAIIMLDIIIQVAIEVTKAEVVPETNIICKVTASIKIRTTHSTVTLTVII